MTADRDRNPEDDAGTPTTDGGGDAGGGDGYVHDPDSVENGRIHDPETPRPHQAPPSDDPFDWRGWLLVGVVVVAFLVVPTVILYLPEARGSIASLGLSLRDTYLVLPLVPAFLLGGAAVWAAIRSRG